MTATRTTSNAFRADVADLLRADGLNAYPCRRADVTAVPQAQPGRDSLIRAADWVLLTRNRRGDKLALHQAIRDASDNAALLGANRHAVVFPPDGADLGDAAVVVSLDLFSDLLAQAHTRSAPVGGNA